MAKEVAVEGLILVLREAMVLPPDEEQYARFQASMSGNERQMLLRDLQTERDVLDTRSEAPVHRGVRDVLRYIK